MVGERRTPKVNNDLLHESVPGLVANAVHTASRPEPSVHNDGLQIGAVATAKVALPPRRPNEALLPLLHLLGDELMFLGAL